MSASLAKAKSSSRCWENEAKESVEKMARAKAERDTAHHDASMVRMDADAVSNARAKVESDLARVQNAPWRLQRRLGGRRKTKLVV